MKAAATRRPQVLLSKGTARPPEASMMATVPAGGDRVAPACLYCGAELEPKGRPWDRAWSCPSCGRLRFEGAVSVDTDRRPPLPAPSWWGGATAAEVLTFGLSADCPGSGTGIPALSDSELRRQIAVAGARMESRYRSRWLRRWVDQLLAEARRREAAA
jgi:hypothetical protein